jgi:FkbM family methyltransferase
MAKLFRNLARRVFRACGFDLTRSYAAQRTTMAQVLANVVANGFRPETVIDIGIGPGTPDLYDAFPNSRYLLIEPLAERKPVLEALTKRLDAEYILACAGDKAGTTSIYVNIANLDDSSTYPDLASSTIIERKVQVVTIDETCSSGNFSPPFLLKIDTQGAELKVLAGARKILRQTELVILETQFFKFFGDNPEFFDIVYYMKQSGFVAYDCFGLSYRPFDAAMAAIDLLFVRENGFFRKTHCFHKPARSY